MEAGKTGASLTTRQEGKERREVDSKSKRSKTREILFLLGAFLLASRKMRTGGGKEAGMKILASKPADAKKAISILDTTTKGGRMTRKPGRTAS